MSFVYLNGEINLKEKIGLPLDDIGILRGYGMNEVLRTYLHEPFLFDLHMDRLFSSAQKMNIQINTSRNEILQAMRELIAKNINSNQEGSIKLVLTGGVSTDILCYNPHKPSLFIMVNPFKELPKEIYTKGVKVITLEHQRDLPEIKTLNYTTAIMAQEQKNKKGAFEVVYHKDGLMLEASTSNLFIIEGHTIYTPEKNILKGITRNSVLKIAQKSYKIKKQNVLLKKMYMADEAFLVATNKDIVPIIQVDQQIIGKNDHLGKVGPITKDLMEKYKTYIKKHSNQK